MTDDEMDMFLEEKYGKTVVGMFLVCLHPNNVNKSFQRIEVANLEDEVKTLFEYRKQQLSENT